MTRRNRSNRFRRSRNAASLFYRVPLRYAGDVTGPNSSSAYLVLPAAFNGNAFRVVSISISACSTSPTTWSAAIYASPASRIIATSIRPFVTCGNSLTRTLRNTPFSVATQWGQAPIAHITWNALGLARFEAIVTIAGHDWEYGDVPASLSLRPQPNDGPTSSQDP